MKLRDVKNRVLTRLYPPRCPFCDGVLRTEDYCCAECKKRLWEHTLSPYALGGVPCAAPFPYADEYAEAVKRFKFRRRPGYAKPLAVPMVQALLEKNAVGFDAVVYVPMHPDKQRVRGYNQAELLAREVAALMGIPCESLLVKTRDNPPQHTMESTAAKQKNVRGLFKAFDKAAVKGKSILLVDDVLTSGATLGECAKVLRRSGAADVFGVTLCAPLKM